MKILYDLISTQPSNNSKFHGGGEYGKIVFEALLKKKNEEVITCIYDERKQLDEKMKNLLDEFDIELVHIQSNADLQNLISIRNFDKFYSPLPYHLTDIDFKSTQLIFTIHGLRELEVPSDKYQIIYNRKFKDILIYIYKYIFKRKYERKMINKYKKVVELLNSSSKNKIIVVSNHTKYAMLDFYPFLEKDKIKVLYSPRKASIKEIDLDISKFKVKKSNYILLVSGNRWIKNVYRAIIALDGIFSILSKCKFKVLVLGVKNEEIFTKKIRNLDKFMFYDYVSEEELDFLYKHAYLFVYPTLNEGFGYPPLESMKHGVPVISSGIASIPEICRDGVVYFNPYNIDELRNRLLSLLTNKDIWNEYSNRGKLVYEEVSKKQDRMLDELIDIILSK